MIATVECKLCGDKTQHTGTRLCDRCWELDCRVRRDPTIAQNILDQMRDEGALDTMYAATSPWTHAAIVVGAALLGAVLATGLVYCLGY